MLIKDTGATHGALVLTGDCTVSGDFTNGGTLKANGHTVTFNGAGLQNLAATATTAFANLTVNIGVTLVETVAANYASVTGALTNFGTIRKTQAISGAGPRTFGLTGVQVDVRPGSLTSLQVDRIDSNQPNATVGIRTGRYWTLTPTGTGYTVRLTLPHDALSDPTACRYTGSGWDCARTAFTPATVTRNACPPSPPGPWGMHGRGFTCLSCNVTSVSCKSREKPGFC